MVQANGEIQKKFPDEFSETLEFIAGGAVFCALCAVFAVFVGILMRPAPYLGALVIWALCFAALFHIYKHHNEIDAKYGSALDRIFGVDGDKGLKKNLADIIAVMILAICGLVMALAIAVDLDNEKIQQNALVQAAMESAPSGSIPTYCIAGKTYIRGSEGEVLALEVNKKPLECTTAR